MTDVDTNDANLADDLAVFRRLDADYRVAYDAALHGEPNRMPDIAHQVMVGLPRLIELAARVSDDHAKVEAAQARARAVFADATTDAAPPNRAAADAPLCEHYAPPGRCDGDCDHAPAAPVDATLTDDERRKEVNRVARLLIAEWERIEGPVSVSYVASFADLARAVVTDARRTSVDRAKVEAALALADEWDDNDIPWDPGRDEARRLRAVLLGAPTTTERGGKITHG